MGRNLGNFHTVLKFDENSFLVHTKLTTYITNYKNFTFSGILGGLVGITAGCGIVSNAAAAFIGGGLLL